MFPCGGRSASVASMGAPTWDPDGRSSVTDISNVLLGKRGAWSLTGTTEIGTVMVSLFGGSPPSSQATSSEWD